MSEAAFAQEKEEMLSYISGEGLLQELEEFSVTYADTSFVELIRQVMQEGLADSMQDIGEYLVGLFIQEVAANKQLMVQLIVLVMAFGILQNFLGTMENGYVSDLSYLLTYFVFMVIMLKSFGISMRVAEELLHLICNFTKILLPAYLGVMVFAGNAMSAMAFQEITYLVLWGIEMVMLTVLVPMIQIYVLIALTNAMFKEEFLTKTLAFIKDIFNWGTKGIMAIVVALNVVQGMIAPAVDYAGRGTLTKSLSLIPGVGNAATVIGDIFIGSGMIIKGSIGVAALIILVIMALLPFLKVLIITLMYKLVSAIIEPVADKRISTAVGQVADGGTMLLRVIVTTVFMIFITIAMMCSTSSYIS